MKAEIKEVNSNTRELIVTIDNETAQKDFQKVFNKIRKTMEIPGFRKGKVPTTYVEKNFKEYIQNEYFDKYAGDYYKEAIETVSAKPITPGNFKDVVWNTGEDAVFTFEYQCFPEGFEPNYKNLEVEYKNPDYDMNKQIESAIKDILTSNATQNPFDENDVITNDNIITIAFEANNALPEPYFDDSELSLRVGDKKFGEDLDDKLLGLKINSIFTAEFVDNENEIKYNYQFKVVDAFKVQLPELTDDFAKSMDYESVEDMKNKLKAEFEDEYNATKDRSLEQAIVMAVAKANPLEIPDDYFIQAGRYMIEKNYGSDAKGLEDNILLNFGKAFTEAQTVFDLVVERIKDIEKFEITDEDKDEYIKIIIRGQKHTLEEYKENYKHFVESENFIAQATQFKIVKLIKETIKIVEPKEVEAPIAETAEISQESETQVTE